LLVHGFAGRASQMGAFVRPLLEQGFGVVAFDFVAHGAAGGRQTLLPEMADALEVVARHLGPIHGIVAHSLGASAVSLAISRGLNVQRLAYISPPDDPEAYLFRMALKLGFSTRVAGRAKQRLENRFGLSFDKARGAELVQDFQKPALILHDCGDSVVPIEEGALLHRHWEGSQLYRTRDLGHNRILRDEGVIARAVDFVTES
jgi:pimeloyl-ACP methyl ester carboxylesterase